MLLVFSAERTGCRSHMGCTLRWVGVGGISQGNGPKDLPHFYGFSSFFCSEGFTSSVKMGVALLEGLKSLTASRPVWEAWGRKHSSLVPLLSQAHHVPCNQQLRVCPVGHVPGVTGLRASCSWKSTFNRLQVGVQLLHFHRSMTCSWPVRSRAGFLTFLRS